LTDIDNENRIVTCTPTKYDNPRQFKASGALIAMHNTLAKTGNKVFGNTSLITHRNSSIHQRRRISQKLQNLLFLEVIYLRL